MGKREFQGNVGSSYHKGRGKIPGQQSNDVHYQNFEGVMIKL